MKREEPSSPSCRPLSLSVTVAREHAPLRGHSAGELFQDGHAGGGGGGGGGDISGKKVSEEKRDFHFASGRLLRGRNIPGRGKGD